ncbi:PPE family protein, SVP subgroup [Mycobacterium senriense]|uniref:PPE family protein n=2 Tax=Mycobacterium senriense TaxID=2775496 RepID=A0ABM7SQZ7_9MYCO|nr:PPE domain-containing protein [Mycobacterium senriense]BCZ23718.1 PPE family protein [Mycobacterium senriense]
MHFAVLPPEVNSGRMYAGPGAGSLLAAATAWDELANELHTTAANMESVISGLTSEPWHGPSAVATAAAAAPQVAWLTATAEQATQAGAQAKAAATAYESAYAATVHPSVIAANRSQLSSLVATNLLGQNTPAIAATEVAYGEMWAQDVAAMYGYAGASHAASQVTPFTPPKRTTNQGGLAAQTVATTQAAGTSAGHVQSALSSNTMSAVPNALQNLTTSSTASSGLSDLSSFMNPYNLVSLGSAFLGNGTGLIGVSGAAGFISDTEHKIVEPGTKSKAVPEKPAVSRSPGKATTVSAGMGRANSLGSMSVPQGWSTAAPEVRLTALESPDAGALPASRAGSGLFSGQMPLFGGAPLMAMPGRGTPDGRGRQPADTSDAPGRQVPAAAALQKRGQSPRSASTGTAAELREVTDVLGKLAELRATGALTDTEFAEQKQRLLGTG